MKDGVMTFEVGMKGVVKNSHTDHGIRIPKDIGRNEPGQVGQIRLITQGIRQLAH